jgi:hypothetical protein
MSQQGLGTNIVCQVGSAAIVARFPGRFLTNSLCLEAFWKVL